MRRLSVINLGYRNDLDAGDVDGPDGEITDNDFTDEELTDEELTALALADEPDDTLDADAVALNLYPSFGAGFLPTWYMPPVMSRASRTWRTPVVLAIIIALFTIDAFGLCITYGQLVGA